VGSEGNLLTLHLLGDLGLHIAEGGGLLLHLLQPALHLVQLLQLSQIDGGSDIRTDVGLGFRQRVMGS
jgi:hypothetical protein